jgi:hypothetical protein
MTAWWWSNDRKLSRIIWIIKYCCVRLNTNIFSIVFQIRENYGWCSTQNHVLKPMSKSWDSASHRWIENYTLDSKWPSSFCTKSDGRRWWTVTALRCNHVEKVEMSLAHWDCHSPSACGCAGSDDGASKQVTVTICCYFNNTSKSNACLSYSCDVIKLKSNGDDCLLLDSVTFRDENLSVFPSLFGTPTTEANRPWRSSARNMRCTLSSWERHMMRFRHVNSVHCCVGTA